MLARLQRALGEVRVQVERRSDHHRVEILMDEFLEIDIAGHVQLIADLVQAVLEVVADRNQLHAGRLGGFCEGLSAERAQNAHANFALGDGFVHAAFSPSLKMIEAICTILYAESGDIVNRFGGLRYKYKSLRQSMISWEWSSSMKPCHAAASGRLA